MHPSPPPLRLLFLFIDPALLHAVPGSLSGHAVPIECWRLLEEIPRRDEHRAAATDRSTKVPDVFFRADPANIAHGLSLWSLTICRG
jgi:hypothetical protein